MIGEVSNKKVAIQDSHHLLKVARHRGFVVMTLMLLWVFIGFPLLQVANVLPDNEVLAATTGNLVPTSGGLAGTGWLTKAGSQCSVDGTNCYVEVDDTPASDDGDSSYIEKGTQTNIDATFDITVSSIPNGATITAIDVTFACRRQATNGPGSSLDAIYRVDSGAVQVASQSDTCPRNNGGAYSSFTRSFTGLTIIKSSGTDLEVGVRGSNNREAYVTSIYTNITYELPMYDQEAYRFFANNNSTDVGSALAAQNALATLTSAGEQFRLRIIAHTSNAGLVANGETFKLQFVGKGTGSCASPIGGNPSSYTDVTGSTIIAYNDNAAVSDGVALTGNANDPVVGGHTARNQTYEESNNFTNSQTAVAVGEDAKWDFSLYDNGAAVGSTFCFRVVKSDGALLNSYTVYPEITTASNVLNVDIVDGSGNSVSSPTVAFGTITSSDQCQISSGTMGISAEKIRVLNQTGNPAWSLSAAATGGTNANWSNGTDTYDFNDSGGSPEGCADSSDGDSLIGQLSIDPSVASVTPEGGCTTSGISLGSTIGFDQGVTDNITLVYASAGADTGCYWDLTDIALSQRIPSLQPTGAYNLQITITVVAN